MHTPDNGPDQKPAALLLLASERPRNVGWMGAAGLLFGDWGTSRLYVLGLAFLFAGRTSFYLIAAMSLLILAVGWAYTQICRIYADGGGVYSAARHRSRLLGVVGALLLFADYTVTASLSSLDAFHYLGLGSSQTVQVSEPPADDHIELHHDEGASAPAPLWQLNSPGLWAIIAILFIGVMNLLGPKHTASFAIVAAIGMVGMTLLVVAFALPQISWSDLSLGSLRQPPLAMWEAFVAIVLALSGVEAIANLTGVMKKPVYATAKKSIWTVATEVAVFNLLLALVMVSVTSLGRQEHKEDMLAFLAGNYVGLWGEWFVRIVAGILLLSATNTAINGLISITYIMSRDGELPRALQKLNGFGSPWLAAIVAAGVPVIVLLFAHDLVTLASLYAIGVCSAVAINISLCAWHPRLRRWRRRLPMAALGLFLVCITLTLAFTKLHALMFVSIVLATGLIARKLTQWRRKIRPQPTLLQRAIAEQLPPESLSRPRVMLATAGSLALAKPALSFARERGAALVVCFVRTVSLSYMFNSERRLTIDTDHAAQELFIDFLELGHQYGVPIIPTYDTGANPAELIAEHAALNAVETVLLGSSRRGVLHQLIKGSFQRAIENLLPPEIPVHVLSAEERPSPATKSTTAPREKSAKP